MDKSENKLKNKQEALHDAAEQRTRDWHGHFVAKKDPKTAEIPTPSVTSNTNVSGPLEAVSHLLSVEKGEGSADETLVDVKVHNPFTRVLKMLQEIKNHQSTTVSMRFTIPLIALPIVLLAAFQLGRAQAVCASRFTSQTGTLRIVSVLAPKQATDSFGMLLSFFPDIPHLQKKAELQPAMKTILVSTNGEVLNILNDPTMDLTIYNATPVILTGTLSPCSGTITLDAPQNITSIENAL